MSDLTLDFERGRQRRENLAGGRTAHDSRCRAVDGSQLRAGLGAPGSRRAGGRRSRPKIRAVPAGFARQAVGRGRGQARGLRWNDIDRIVDTVAE